MLTLDHRFALSNTGDAATRDSFTFQATDAAGDQTPVSAFNITIGAWQQGPGSAGQTPASSSAREATSPAAPLFDLSDIGFGATTTLGYSANGDNTGGALTVSDGMHTANLALLGQYAASGFAAAPDQAGGTLVTYTAAQGGSDTPNLLAIPQH
jgi:hypothetical protein